MLKAETTYGIAVWVPTSRIQYLSIPGNSQCKRYRKERETGAAPGLPVAYLAAIVALIGLIGEGSFISPFSQRFFGSK